MAKEVNIEKITKTYKDVTDGVKYQKLKTQFYGYIDDDADSLKDVLKAVDKEIHDWEQAHKHDPDYETKVDAVNVVMEELPDSPFYEGLDINEYSTEMVLWNLAFVPWYADLLGVLA